MERKDAFLKVRLSATQKERVKELAGIAGCNESELLRDLLARARVVVVPSVIESNSNASGHDLAVPTGIAR